MMARWLALLVALALVLHVARSLAQPAERRVVLSDFEGKQAKAARAWLIAGLEDAGVDVVPKADVFASGEPTSADGYAALARQQRLSAFITGKLQKGARGYKLELVVRNGADGRKMQGVEVDAPSLPKLKAKLVGKVPEGLAAALEQTAAPPAPAEAQAEPEPAQRAAEQPAAPPPVVAETAQPATSAADRPAAEPSYPLLELALGIRGYSRDLTYNDDLFDKLARFELGAAPAVFAAVRVYPLASSSRGFLRHIGVAGAFEQGFATTMRDIRGRELGVSTRQFHVGLRSRLPVGLNELGVTAGYGMHRLEAEEPSAPELVPDVDYEFLRASFDARFRVSSFLFGFHAGYRVLLSMGPFESEPWFPRASGAGVEGGAFIGQVLSDQFELYGGFDMLRYFFALNPEPGDAQVAGGALDQYLSLWAAVGWRWQ